MAGLGVAAFFRFLSFLSLVLPAYSFWYPNGLSALPSSDATGRYVAFATVASNFIFEDINDFGDVYLWDTAADQNSSAALHLMSEGVLGSPAKGIAEYGILSADGQAAFFVGRAKNYVSSPSIPCSESLIYKYDIGARFADPSNTTVITRRVKLLSVTNSGAVAQKPTYICGTSANGRFIVFHTTERGFVSSPVVVAPGLPSTHELVYWMDTETGISQIVSVNLFGNVTADRRARCSSRVSWSQASGSFPTLTADGRFVVFTSQARTLTEELLPAVNLDNIFVRDMERNVTQLITGSRFSPTPNTVDRTFYSHCNTASIAANATTVAFWCRRSSFVNGVVVFDTIVCDFSEDPSAALNCSIVSVNATDSSLVSDTQLQTPESAGAPVLDATGTIVVWATNARDIIDDVNYFGPPGYFPSRLLLRNRTEAATVWLVQRNQPDSFNEYRPFINWNATRVFWEGNSPDYIPGTNATSEQQIYYEDIATGSRNRPVMLPCPYSTKSECDKVALQLQGVITDVVASINVDLIAFGTNQPDFMEPSEALYKGYVCAARVCNPSNSSEIGPAQGFLTPNQKEGTFVYFRSTTEEVTDMIYVDRRMADPSTKTFPFVTPLGISSDGRYILHKAQSTVKIEPNGLSCNGSLYVYDSIRREHQLLLPPTNDSCVVNAMSVSMTGNRVVVTVEGPYVPIEPRNWPGRSVYSVDVATMSVTIESTNATWVPIYNETGDIVDGYWAQQQIPADCDYGLISGNQRWAVFSCKTPEADVVYVLDRTNVMSTAQPISTNASGLPWTDVFCRARSISDTGRFIALECTNWQVGGYTVVGSNSSFLSPLFEVAVVVVDRSQTEYSSRVFVIPPPRSLQGPCQTFAHRIYGPTMPLTEQAESDFFVVATYAAPLEIDFSIIPVIWYRSTPFQSKLLFEEAHSSVGVVSVSTNGRQMVLVTSSYLLAPYDVNGRSDVYFGNFDGTRLWNVSLITARDNYYTSVLPNFNCLGLRPHPRFECIDGIWTLLNSGSTNTILLRSDVSVQTGSIARTENNATVLAAGSLSVACNASFTLGQNTTMLFADRISLCGTINITFARPDSFIFESLGCAQFNSSFYVNIGDARLPGAGTNMSIPILGYTSLCPTESQAQVFLESGPVDDCVVSTQTNEIRPTGLFVVLQFSQSQETRCQPPLDSQSPVVADLSLGIAIGVPLGIIGAVAMVAVILVAVPTLRAKVFPFLDRRSNKGKTVDVELENDPVHRASISGRSKSSVNSDNKWAAAHVSNQ